jgi:glutathione reductase (NADPH)
MNPTPARTEDFDLLVIGGGSGGVRAARMAAQRGARVAIAESGAWGGTCVNVGCIPKKLYSYAAHYAQAFEESAGFGWQGTAPRLDWATLKARRATEILRLNGIYQNLLTQAGVTLLTGVAQVTGAHSATVNGQPVTARHLLVATGGQPVVPDIPGREWALTSDQIFDVDPFPARLVVVGGGYIACEFASIFQGLGARVTQLHRGDGLLRGLRSCG